ncbi:DinB family protein [Streptomyces sp. NPDC126499]|uniref:DinB family protein n=1 Tax=Streptomyces sp. NPDC126499 TaxID=3155314 RepID=UPI0033272019
MTEIQDADRARVDVGPPDGGPDERATLLAFLGYLRQAVAAKAQGLDPEAARRPGVPSGTSLLGLVKHLTAAETYWFVRSFEGEEGPAPDLGMEVTEEDDPERLLAAYREACRRSDAVVAACGDLDTLAVRPAGHKKVRRSLRWILVHMIEETARHAGHADILREQADGAVGR